MANNMTDVLENLLLDLGNGVTTAAPITGPLKLALVTAIGSDSAAGTEVSGGSYARQTLAMTSAASGSSSNSATIQYTNMPACTVVGFDVYDSSATPKRLWWIPAAANKTYALGDVAQVTIGSITVSID